MATFAFTQLTQGPAPKDNVLVTLADKQANRYSVKFVEDCGYGQIQVLSITTIFNTLIWWNSQARTPMCSLIGLFNALHINGIAITCRDFFEKGVRMLPAEGFLVGEEIITNTFNNLRRTFPRQLISKELIVCTMETMPYYKINENSIIVWNCEKDVVDEGLHFTPAVFTKKQKPKKSKEHDEEAKLSEELIHKMLIEDAQEDQRIMEQHFLLLEQERKNQDAVKEHNRLLQEYANGGW
jgi:hypothetical protein